MAVPTDMQGRDPTVAAHQRLKSRKGGPSLLPTRLGGATKILAMGGVLAGLMFVMFFYRPEAEVSIPPNVGMSRPAAEVTTPELDRALLAEVADAERNDRLVLEEEAFRDLLTKALNVTPTVAIALGRPDRPIPLKSLRANPDRYRGQWLYYKGTLESLSAPQSGHPVRGYSRYDAVVRLDGDSAADHRVECHFSLPPDPGLQEGDYVEAAGFFMKLRDANLPLQMDQAPLLVGRLVRSTFPDREPVTTLDSSLLDKLEDDYSRTEHTEGSDRGLLEEQREPLWHIASYASQLDPEKGPDPWANLPPLSQLEQYWAFRKGEVSRGTPARILGTFVQGRRLPAQPNPYGFRFFSEIWVQVRSWGGKLLPVWIPGDVGDLEYNDPIEVRGFYFKDYTYQPYAREENKMSERIYAPVFVSASVLPWEPIRHPAMRTIGWVFAAFVGLITLLFFVQARADKRASARNHEALVARRRRRREKAGAGSEAPAEA